MGLGGAGSRARNADSRGLDSSPWNGTRAQTVAKDKYLLTEGDLKKLGSISKENPRHREWQPMRLYLQSQVERISRDKHGDEESLERTRDERVKKRILRKQERTVQNKAKDERKAKRLKITKERIEREYGDAARVHTCEVQVEEI